MNKIGLILLYTASTLVFIGGLGDLFIFNYLEVHLDFLGNPESSELLKKSEKLSMLMLHSAGGGLMSTGVSMIALTHFGIRNNQTWAKWTLLIIAFLSQGINAYGMYSAGSHFWYPVVVLIFTLAGMILYRKKETHHNKS